MATLVERITDLAVAIREKFNLVTARIDEIGSTQLTASEGLTEGDFVYIFNDGGIASCCKASAADDTKPADGFVLADAADGDPVRVYTIGTNDKLVGLTIGPIFLSVTPGVASSAGATGSGENWQQIGTAVSATSAIFSRQIPVKRA